MVQFRMKKVIYLSLYPMYVIVTGDKEDCLCDAKLLIYPLRRSTTGRTAGMLKKTSESYYSYIAVLFEPVHVQESF